MSDIAIEAAARTVCRTKGLDPNAILLRDGGAAPAWRHYIGEAQEIIRAYLSKIETA